MSSSSDALSIQRHQNFLSIKVAAGTAEPVESQDSNVEEELPETIKNIKVTTGTCATVNLFRKKQICHGAFKTFELLLTFMTITQLIENPRVYHVKQDTPKDIIDNILGDLHAGCDRHSPGVWI